MALVNSPTFRDTSMKVSGLMIANMGSVSKHGLKIIPSMKGTSINLKNMGKANMSGMMVAITMGTLKMVCLMAKGRITSLT